MPVRPEELESLVQRQLAPAYLIAGDETLLVEEAAGVVMAAAQQQGYSERNTHFVESGFDWSLLRQEGAAMSLFAERKVIDLRLAGGKVDRGGSEALRDYLASPPDDVLLILRTPKLDRSQRSSSWFKAFDKVGAAVVIWGIDARGWPRWLQGRLRGAGLKMEEAAFRRFSALVEGNLLAAVQEIEKLKLAGLAEPITLAALEGAMDDASNYDVFELIDAVFAGQPARVAHIVRSLKDAGISPFAVLGPFVSQLRQLQGGGGWMPRDRKQNAERFVSRIGRLEGVLSECALVDQQGKGQLLGDAWLSLERLLLRLAGVRKLTLLGEQLPAVRRA